MKVPDSRRSPGSPSRGSGYFRPRRTEVSMRESNLRDCSEARTAGNRGPPTTRSITTPAGKSGSPEVVVSASTRSSRIPATPGECSLGSLPRGSSRRTMRAAPGECTTPGSGTTASRSCSKKRISPRASTRWSGTRRIRPSFISKTTRECTAGPGTMASRGISWPTTSRRSRASRRASSGHLDRAFFVASVPRRRVPSIPSLGAFEHLPGILEEGVRLLLGRPLQEPRARCCNRAAHLNIRGPLHRRQTAGFGDCQRRNDVERAPHPGPMDRHLSLLRRHSLFDDGGPGERAADEGDARLDCPAEMVRIDYLNRVWIIDRGGEFLRIQKERPGACPRRPDSERALEVHGAPPSRLTQRPARGGFSTPSTA